MAEGRGGSRALRAKLLVLTILALGLQSELSERAATGAVRGWPAMDRPNFLVVMTDDQRWDSLWAMPYVDGVLRRRSVDFPNAYVTTPVCCPVRAGFLAGGFYAHNTGVLNNSGPNGGAPAFDDRRTLPYQLQRDGYRTALIGKYMNGYDLIAPWVPTPPHCRPARTGLCTPATGCEGGWQGIFACHMLF